MYFQHSTFSTRRWIGLFNLVFFIVPGSELNYTRLPAYPGTYEPQKPTRHIPTSPVPCPPSARVRDRSTTTANSVTRPLPRVAMVQSSGSGTCRNVVTANTAAIRAPSGRSSGTCERDAAAGGSSQEQQSSSSPCSVILICGWVSQSPSPAARFRGGGTPAFPHTTPVWLA